MQSSWRGLRGVLECLGNVLNSCYAQYNTHRDMHGWHLCVHKLPWPRKRGHINGTLPERLLLMFAYTWSPARLPPMCSSPRDAVVLSALRCVVLRSVALRYIERERERHRLRIAIPWCWVRRLCCVVLSYVELCRIELLCCTELCWVVLNCIDLYWVIY